MERIRRQYTPEFKREAVALVIEQGYAVTAAARNLGINFLSSLGKDIDSYLITISPLWREPWTCCGLVEMDTSKREDTLREVFYGKDSQTIHTRI